MFNLIPRPTHPWLYRFVCFSNAAEKVSHWSEDPVVCGVANQLASLALHPSLLLCKPKDNITIVVLDISYHALYPMYMYQ